MKITYLSGPKTKSKTLQTTIPSEIVKKLNLKKGDRFIWVLEENKIIILPVKD